MKKYFTDKLKDIKRQIENTKKYIIDAVTNEGSSNSANINDLVKMGASLRNLLTKYEEFTKDAVKHLSVEEVIEMLKEDLFKSLYDVQYVYKYDRSVTVQEAQTLKAYSYQFTDLKIKM